MEHPLITLTTDFGLRDPYVAEMKAVILGINPDCTIIDISHQIEKFNIRMGAYVLASCVPYFPRGTIHVAVVDPGVGGKRDPIAIETETCFFIGPDNGVLVLAARKSGKLRQVRKITNRGVMLPTVSRTFHGRDIFAPAAAHLACGKRITSFGPEISEIVTPTFARIDRKENQFEGEIMHIDDFGNIITNLERSELESAEFNGTISLEIKKREMTLKICKTYIDVEEKKFMALFGSHGFLEISVNRGSAARALKAEVGDRIKICLC